MSQLISYIRDTFFNFEGVLSRGSAYEIPEELEALYKQLYTDKGRNPRHIDKQNMRADGQRVYRGFKKAVRKHKVGKRRS